MDNSCPLMLQQHSRLLMDASATEIRSGSYRSGRKCVMQTVTRTLYRGENPVDEFTLQQIMHIFYGYPNYNEKIRQHGRTISRNLSSCLRNNLT